MTSLKFAAIQALMGEGEVSDEQKSLFVAAFPLCVQWAGGGQLTHKQRRGASYPRKVTLQE